MRLHVAARLRVTGVQQFSKSQITWPRVRPGIITRSAVDEPHSEPRPRGPERDTPLRLLYPQPNRSASRHQAPPLLRRPRDKLGEASRRRRKLQITTSAGSIGKECSGNIGQTKVAE